MVWCVVYTSFLAHADGRKSKKDTDKQPIVKFYTLTPAFMFAAASAIRGNHEVTGGSTLIRILQWRSSWRGKVIWSLKRVQSVMGSIK